MNLGGKPELDLDDFDGICTADSLTAYMKKSKSTTC